MDNYFYVCLYGPMYDFVNGLQKVMSTVIKKLSKSDFAHASWAPNLDGLFKSMTSKNIVYEDLRTGKNLLYKDGSYYYIFRYKLTPEEYSRAVKLFQYNSDESKIRYDTLGLIPAGINLMVKRDSQLDITNKYFAEDSNTDENDVEFKKFLFCSAYVATIMAKVSPRLKGELLKIAKLNRITPSDLIKIPSAEFMFKGQVGNFNIDLRRYNSLNIK